MSISVLLSLNSERAIIVHTQAVADWSTQVFLLPHDAKGSEVCKCEQHYGHIDGDYQPKRYINTWQSQRVFREWE